MGRKSSCLALLLYSAVPIPNSETDNSGSRTAGGRRRHIHQELINIVVRDAVQMLFESLPPSEIAAAGCPPPPNTPSAVSNGQPKTVFTFPPPPTSDEIASQLILRRKDGNEADDSNSDSDCDISYSAATPVELKPVQRRKRNRVCSFSNSSAAVRRVPHKKQCHVTPPPPKNNDDDLSDNDCLSMTSCESRLSVTATTPTYRRQSIYTARQTQKVTAIPPTNCDQVDYHSTIPSSSDQWKNLGKDLNTIATKFTTTIPKYSKRKVSEKASSSAGSLIPANMITVAVNIFLWKMLKKWFD